MRTLLASTNGTWLTRVHGILRDRAERTGLLGERGLREELLALQVLDTVLHLGNFGFVDFEGRLNGRCG